MVRLPADRGLELVGEFSGIGRGLLLREGHPNSAPLRPTGLTILANSFFTAPRSTSYLVVKIRRKSPPRSEPFCGFAAYSRGSICRIRSTRFQGNSTVGRPPVAEAFRLCATGLLIPTRAKLLLRARGTRRRACCPPVAFRPSVFGNFAPEQFTFKKQHRATSEPTVPQ